VIQLKGHADPRRTHQRPNPPPPRKHSPPQRFWQCVSEKPEAFVLAQNKGGKSRTQTRRGAQSRTTKKDRRGPAGTRRGVPGRTGGLNPGLSGAEVLTGLSRGPDLISVLVRQVERFLQAAVTKGAGFAEGEPSGSACRSAEQLSYEEGVGLLEKEGNGLARRRSQRPPDQGEARRSPSRSPEWNREDSQRKLRANKAPPS